MPPMNDPVRYRSLAEGDLPAVCELVERVFDGFIAPEYSEEGIREFRRYIQPEAFMERMHAGHFSLIAETAGRIIGMVEIRGCNHISLFFVDPQFHKRGIGRELFRQAEQTCRKENPNIREISVNASSYAMPVYEKLGFRRVGEKQVRNGIGFIPMIVDCDENEKEDLPKA